MAFGESINVRELLRESERLYPRKVNLDLLTRADFEEDAQRVQEQSEEATTVEDVAFEAAADKSVVAEDHLADQTSAGEEPPESLPSVTPPEQDAPSSDVTDQPADAALPELATADDTDQPTLESITGPADVSEDGQDTSDVQTPSDDSLPELGFADDSDQPAADDIQEPSEEAPAYDTPAVTTVHEEPTSSLPAVDATIAPSFDAPPLGDDPQTSEALDEVSASDVTPDLDDAPIQLAGVPEDATAASLDLPDSSDEPAGEFDSTIPPSDEPLDGVSEADDPEQESVESISVPNVDDSSYSAVEQDIADVPSPDGLDVPDVSDGTVESLSGGVPQEMEGGEAAPDVPGEMSGHEMPAVDVSENPAASIDTIVPGEQEAIEFPAPEVTDVESSNISVASGPEDHLEELTPTGLVEVTETDDNVDGPQSQLSSTIKMLGDEMAERMLAEQTQGQSMMQQLASTFDPKFKELHQLIPQTMAEYLDRKNLELTIFGRWE